MKKELKSHPDGKILRHWLDYSVPRADYNKQKRRLVEECLVSASTLRNWIYGRCRIPDAGKRDINKVTMEYSGYGIFDIAKPSGCPGGVTGAASGEAVRNMERVIAFNGKSALLCAGEHNAMLTINEYTLPTGLADAIGEAGDVYVSGVFLDNICRTGVIRILHDLDSSALLEIVCEAISRVFDADTSVSYA